MNHLDDDRLLELLTAPATREEKKHLARCPRCREALGSWKETLGALRELEQEEVSDGEIHRLRVLFRQMGPSPRRRRWLARLVQPGPGLSQAAATRGMLTPSLSEYRAGDLALVLQVSPSRQDNLYEIHGAVEGGDQEALQDGAVVLLSGRGFGDAAEPDSLGEFHFHNVPPGTYSMSWTSEELRVDVEDLNVGAAEEEPDA